MTDIFLLMIILFDAFLLNYIVGHDYTKNKYKKTNNE